MAEGRSDEEEDPNDIIVHTAGTITSPPPLPTLPFDVFPEFLGRLPIKLLVQLRCLCKFFYSLIADPTFAKKHLQLSTKRHHLMITSWNNLAELVEYVSPIPSVLSTSIVVTHTQLYPPNTLTIRAGSYLLWNPSIRKYTLLPPLENHIWTSLSFGYDHFIDNYKVVVVSSEKEVFFNTLGADYWKRIEGIPHYYDICGVGIFVSDTVNWLAIDESSSYFILISLDFEESYQQLLLPESENDSWTLSAARDCLCVSRTSDTFMNIWIMKEYGNQESWTKLYIVPNLQDWGFIAYKDLYISEDDKLLMHCYVMGRDLRYGVDVILYA
ncbi:F-box/kelch-repeat protein At3g23880 [Medicago truncatula]|uniref:F-box/kelch-repeat protein At3g23880 n=1 Tax=Medicago truncatula TaxID=3880 RepID=UPI0019689880|nr:F-box/kelch-repeat protein At3g23880 [Medicago truncatula]